jgi:hypothetical protein
MGVRNKIHNDTEEGDNIDIFLFGSQLSLCQASMRMLFNVAKYRQRIMCPFHFFLDLASYAQTMTFF